MPEAAQAQFILRPAKKGHEILVSQELATEETGPFQAIQTATGFITGRAATRAGLDRVLWPWHSHTPGCHYASSPALSSDTTRNQLSKMPPGTPLPEGKRPRR